MQELREPQPGSALIAEHVAQALLIEALRLRLAEHSHDRTGWLFALADRQMRAVIGNMHAEPGRKWTLKALARVAGMSQSSFAVRFKETVGEAGHGLSNPLVDDRSVRSTRERRDAHRGRGADVGYESESAFGAAFNRVMGYSPRQFARSTAS